MTTKHYCIEIRDCTLEQLCNYAIQQGIQYVWVLAHSALEVHRADFTLSEREWSCLPNWLYDEDVERMKGDNILASVHLYRKGELVRRRTNIIFLKHCRWAWNRPDITPKELAATVIELEGLVGVPVGGSPAGTGMKFLEKQLQERNAPADETKRPAWLRPPELDLKATPWGQAPKPLIWSRIPTEEELQRKYLWAFDKNSAYGRAAVNEKFGVFQPVRVDQMHVGAMYHDLLPGMWLVKMHGMHELNEIDWSLVPPVPLEENTPTWLSTPQVKLCRQRGCDMELLEGWYFPNSEYLWRKWAQSLWNIRQGFAAGCWQREAIKQILNDTMGLSNKIRSDWYRQFVDGAATVMHYNIALYALRGSYPIGCMVDCLYYLSDAREPQKAVSGILDHTTSLGGYKVKWGLEVTDEVREILLLPSWNKKLERLNELAETRGVHG